MLVFAALASTCGAAACTDDFGCSLNGVCAAGACACEAPWTGAQCGAIAFAAASPAAGRDIYDAYDTAHNTWNGPIVGPIAGDSGYHAFVPLYDYRGPGGGTSNLYHPVSLMHGSAPTLYGPWRWENVSGADNPQNVTGFNPGFLTFNDSTGNTVYSLWIEGSPEGVVYTSTSPGGPWAAVPGSSNTTACNINPVALRHNGSFYCTGGKGTTIMTAPAIGGPWAVHGEIGAVHPGEDPHLWIDARGGWHMLYHAANHSQLTNCGSSRTAAHIFSGDGKVWRALEHPVEPYKPRVVWTDGEQTYTSFERPTPFFDDAGRMTHLGLAGELTIGDEGCSASPIKCGKHQGACPCSECKYQGHTGTLLVELWDGIGPAPAPPAPAPSPPVPSPPKPPPSPLPGHPCADFGQTPVGYTCHSGRCPGASGHCGATLAEPALDLSGGCSFASSASVASMQACVTAAAVACGSQPGCGSFALDPDWHGSTPKAKLFAGEGTDLTVNAGWSTWVNEVPPPPPTPPTPPAPQPAAL